MDFSIIPDEIESGISRFQQGVERVEDVMRQLDNEMQALNGGGFTGQMGDMLMELMQRRRGMMSDLRQVYSAAGNRLNQTLNRIHEMEEELRKRIMDF